MKIDRDGAIEFARRKMFYSSLIRYYYEIGEHERAVGLFEEAIGTKTDRERLSKDSYLYRDVFDSVKKFKGLEVSRGKRILDELFSICYSLKHYDHCVDVGMQLQDKELLSRLIEKKFNVESRLKLLDYLRDEMQEVVEPELKKFAEALIEQKGDYAYAKAVECSFVLRQIQDDTAWRGYIKGLYERHSRKINLWREFKRKGVTAKRVKGDVRLDT